MRANVDSVTISIDDVWKLLEAEEALKPFIPNTGISGARALWDFFGRIHRIALHTQDRDLEMSEAFRETPNELTFVPRKTQCNPEYEKAMEELKLP